MLESTAYILCSIFSFALYLCLICRRKRIKSEKKLQSMFNDDEGMIAGNMQSLCCVAGCVAVSWSLLVPVTGSAGASL